MTAPDSNQRASPQVRAGGHATPAAQPVSASNGSTVVTKDTSDKTRRSFSFSWHRVKCVTAVVDAREEYTRGANRASRLPPR